ncbi:MAG: putative quinol monooxygenase [Parvularculaceae bacterium]
MAILRINDYQAKPGVEEALHSALLAAVPVIANLEGCRHVRLLSCLDDPARYIIFEEWDSIEAHKKAAQAIPADMIAKVASLLAGTPKGAFFRG